MDMGTTWCCRLPRHFLLLTCSGLMSSRIVLLMWKLPSISGGWSLVASLTAAAQ